MGAIDMDKDPPMGGSLSRLENAVGCGVGGRLDGGSRQGLYSTGRNEEDKNVHPIRNDERLALVGHLNLEIIGPA